MPYATAPGRHRDASGTSTSATPKCTYVSATIAPTWTAVNTNPSAPR